MQWKKMLAPSLRRCRVGKAIPACVLALGASVFPGCMDCQDQFCKVTRKVGFDIYWIRVLCCEDPHRLHCQQIVPLIPQLTNLMVDMQLACDQENWQRMRQIWHEIKRLGLPSPFVQHYKDIFCDREVQRGVNSHPFFGPGDVFRVPGVFAAVGDPVPIVVMPGSIDSPWMESEPRRISLRQVPEILWEREYVLEPGALFHAETWLGSQTFTATGALAIAQAQGSLEDWCRKNRPTRMRIDLESADCIGQITLVETDPANQMLLQENGQGVLAARVEVNLYMRNDPTISLEGLFDEAWIELPVRHDGDQIVLSPEGAIDGLTLLPVVPEIAALLPRMSQDDVTAVQNETDCQALGREDLEIFKKAFFECYPDNEE